MSDIVKIGSKVIGDKSPCFIVFEAGPTHSGLDSAKRLIQYAHQAGADAVKFQIFNPDRLVSNKQQMYSYEILINKEKGETETISEPLYDIFVRRHLADSQWIELKEYADSLGLAFFATVGDEEGLNLVTSMKCQSIKIASADVNHHPFLKKVAKTGLCIQLDTGNSTLGEIESAVDLIRNYGGHNNIVIHNCPTGYPAHLESINLRMIPLLKQAFGCPTAYSDHSVGWEMDVAALSLGANLIEKTITEDRSTRSVEHIMSLEPHEMRDFVIKIRDVEIALGSSRRVLTAEHLNSRKSIRRSVVLNQDVSKGQKLGDVKVQFKRPGFGLPPDQYEVMSDYVFISNQKTGQIIHAYDLAPLEKFD